jgi:hypothetical protein
MLLQKIVKIQKKIRDPLRIFLSIGFFLFALDSCIALNRWWFDESTLMGYNNYLLNLAQMIIGFVFFIIIASRSKLDAVGYGFFCVAIYYICNYEIGGLSKYYLTPFDPLIGISRTFESGDPASYIYRKTMAYIMSIVSASLLAFSKFYNKKISPQKNPTEK